MTEFLYTVQGFVPILIFVAAALLCLAFLNEPVLMPWERKERDSKDLR